MDRGVRKKKSRGSSTNSSVVNALLFAFAALFVFAGVTIPLLFSRLSDSDTEVAALKTMVTVLSHNTTVIQNLDLVALEAALHPVPVHTIYVNDATGDDSNTGTTAGSPLKTIPAAILKFNDMSANECVVVLANGGYDLGEDPVLDLSVTVERCQKLVIRGPRQNVVTDTVAGLATIGPNFQNVTGTTGGYTPGLYEKRFVENANRSNIYVLRGNTANVLETIAGTVYYYNIPPVELAIDMWMIGDVYSLFTVSANITWDGEFTFIIPDSQEFLWFENLIIGPNYNSRFVGPDHHSTFVRFRGCSLLTAELDPSVDEGAWSGSMFLEGVHIDGEGHYGFNQPQEGTSLNAVSLYMEATIYTNNYGYFHFIYSDFSFTVTFYGYGTSLRIYGYWTIGSHILLFGCTDARIDTYQADDVTGSGLIVQDSNVLANGIKVTKRAGFFPRCVSVSHSRLVVTGLECDTGSGLLVQSSDATISEVSLTGNAGATPLVDAVHGSIVRFFTLTLVKTSGASAGIRIDSGSHVVVGDGDSTVSTSGGSNGIQMSNGAVLSTQADLTNAGAGNDVDFCGLGVVAFPAANANDLAAGTPENCFINRY